MFSQSKSHMRSEVIELCIKPIYFWFENLTALARNKMLKISYLLTILYVAYLPGIIRV